MLQQLPQRYGFARLLVSTASSAILVLGLCSCQTAGMSDITGSLGEKTEVSGASDPQREGDIYRDRFRANPKDADAALQDGKPLRAAGQRPHAHGGVQQVEIAPPGNAPAASLLV